MRSAFSERATITLEGAWESFLADLHARNLQPATIRKYRLLAREMKDFARRRRIQPLVEWNLPTLSDFRQGWKLGPLSACKKLERLRAFFEFALEREWVTQNCARKLKAPKVQQRPTLPFEREEVLHILAALDPYLEQTAPRGRENARRLRSLVLILRWCGIRIGDAVRLTTDKIEGNKLQLYTQKTGVHVWCILPDFVATALHTTPRTSERYFFWSGVGSLEIAVGTWQKRLRKLFRLAGIRGHAHRFRDTFATELLQAGVPMERVSILLGHQSIRMTEKYYAAWTDSRQRQIEADLQRVWDRDPIVQLEMKVTRELRGKNHAVN